MNIAIQQMSKLSLVATIWPDAKSYRVSLRFATDPIIIVEVVEAPHEVIEGGSDGLDLH
jgi:hypothetical protein